MGETKREKKERYEATLAARQAANAKKNKKRIDYFPLFATLAGVILIAIVAVVVIVGNAKSSEPAPAPTSDVTLPSDLKVTVNQETGAVVFGEAAVTVDEYLDFGCPYCNDYSTTNGDAVKQFVADGKIQLSVHPLGMLDNSFQGTRYSTRTANAYYCAAEKAPETLFDFMGALYANQPAEGSKGLTDDRIIEIAKSVGAGAIESCVRDETYSDFVAEKTLNVLKDPEFRGTPLVKVNGEVINSNSVIAAIQGALAE